MLLAFGQYSLLGIIIGAAVGAIYGIVVCYIRRRSPPRQRPVASAEMGVNLNAGGFIGAACGAVLGALIAYALIKADATPKDLGRAMGLGIVGGLIAAALAGNALWRWFFRST